MIRVLPQPTAAEEPQTGAPPLPDQPAQRTPILSAAQSAGRPSWVPSRRGLIAAVAGALGIFLCLAYLPGCAAVLNWLQPQAPSPTATQGTTQ